MNKQIHPVALIAIVVIVVVLLVVFGYHALQPAPYTPSPGLAGPGGGAVPGSTGSPAAVPGRPSAPDAQASSYRGTPHGSPR